MMRRYESRLVRGHRHQAFPGERLDLRAECAHLVCSLLRLVPVAVHAFHLVGR
jgi:hypothetical protein